MRSGPWIVMSIIRVHGLVLGARGRKAGWRFAPNENKTQGPPISLGRATGGRIGWLRVGWLKSYDSSIVRQPWGRMGENSVVERGSRWNHSHYRAPWPLTSNHRRMKCTGRFAPSRRRAERLWEELRHGRHHHHRAGRPSDCARRPLQRPANPDFHT